MEKRWYFQKNGSGTTGHPQAKKKKKNLGTDLKTFVKMTQKSITDLIKIHNYKTPR